MHVRVMVKFTCAWGFDGNLELSSVIESLVLEAFEVRSTVGEWVKSRRVGMGLPKSYCGRCVSAAYVLLHVHIGNIR